MITEDMLQPGASFVSVINQKRRFTVTKRDKDFVEYFYDHWDKGTVSGKWQVSLFLTCVSNFFEPEFIANEEDLWE